MAPSCFHKVFYWTMIYWFLYLVFFQHFSGLEEAVYRNISACKEFADTVRTAYGPNGMNKIVINHIDKLFVTNDAATIIRELEVNECHLFKIANKICIESNKIKISNCMLKEIIIIIIFKNISLFISNYVAVLLLFFIMVGLHIRTTWDSQPVSLKSITFSDYHKWKLLPKQPSLHLSFEYYWCTYNLFTLPKC